jgi:endoplasmic reticulum-Golgi intermediate compartment protein 2
LFAGTPGIFFKYDVSALKVLITIDRENMVQFLVRLCSVIAGIVVMSGFVSHLLRCLLDQFVGRVAPEAVQRMKTFQQQPLLSHAVPMATSPAMANSLGNGPAVLHNNLLINANNIMSQDLAFQKAQFNVPVSLQDDDKH